MKLAILSNFPQGYSPTRFKQAAKALGHSIRVLETKKTSLHVESGKPQIFYKGKAVPRYDAIIPRIGGSSGPYGTSVVRQFERKGVFCVNPSGAIILANDKLRTMQALSRFRINMPASARVSDPTDILPAIERLGGAPVVIKVLSGSAGSGVILAQTVKTAQAIIQALHLTNQDILLQHFVEESSGRDIRAFVVGDRVIASMRRTAQEGEFRSNVHLGGKVEAVELDKEFEHAAIHAAQMLGLRVAGVDLLESNDGPLVMEVNSSPGLQGIESATGVDVATEIIKYIEEQIDFPDMDVKQLLSLNKGFRIVELPVVPKSELANKKIADTNLARDEIMVLSITREGIVIPMPQPAEKLFPGDVLLSFGKELTLRHYMPKKKKTSRKVSQKTKASTPSPL